MEQNIIIDKIDSTNRVHDTSLKKGSWALQFGISNKFTLNEFDGASFSIKRHNTSTTAIRLVIAGKYNSVYQKETNINYGVDKLFRTNLSFIFYINPKAKFKIYGYAGAQYQIKIEAQFDEPIIIREESYGPSAGTGAEFFIINSLSIFAEYNFSFNFGKRRIFYYSRIFPYQLTGSEKFSTKSTENRVNLGMSIYF